MATKSTQSKRGASDAVDAVRGAVERTFQATAEGAAAGAAVGQKRSRDLVDEVTRAAARLRETIEELRVLDDIRGLRGEIESLARRVAALETPGRSRSTTSRSTAASSSRSGSASSRRP